MSARFMSARLQPHQVQGPGDPLSEDTHPEIERRQIEIYRHMSSAQKAALVGQASHTARQLALAGLRERHPQADEAEIRYRLAGLIHGEDLASRAYGRPKPRP